MMESSGASSGDPALVLLVLMLVLALVLRLRPRQKLRPRPRSGLSLLLLLLLSLLLSLLPLLLSLLSSLLFIFPTAAEKVMTRSYGRQQAHRQKLVKNKIARQRLMKASRGSLTGRAGQNKC